MRTSRVLASARESPGPEVFLLAGDATYDAAVLAEQPKFGSPDGVWVDEDGRVRIQTDISNSS